MSTIRTSIPEVAPNYGRNSPPPSSSALWPNRTEDDYQAHEDEVQYLACQLKPNAKHTQSTARRCCDCCSADDARSNRFRRNVRRVVNFLNISPRQKSLILD